MKSPISNTFIAGAGGGGGMSGRNLSIFSVFTSDSEKFFLSLKHFDRQNTCTVCMVFLFKNFWTCYVEVLQSG